MKTWLITPRDPLVLRDGRTTESNMRSLAFPWPSSTTGCLRTFIGTNAQGRFAISVDEALAIEVQGPLLASEEGDLYAPSPADCLWNALPAAHRHGAHRVRRTRLAPSTTLPAGAGFDRADVGDLALLAPVGSGMPREKAAPAPAWWPWSRFQGWLAEPPADAEEVCREDFISSLERDRRMHVKIDAAKRTAEDGALFSTEGVVFHHKGRALSLSLRCAHPELPAKVGSRVTVHLGGERRLSSMAASGRDWPAFDPKMIPEGTRRLRLVLLTPGVFGDGWRPTDGALDGARLIAASVGRPQVISGWGIVDDPARRYGKTRQSGPKPIRRMAPAGSVYWVELPAGAEAGEWARRRWFTSLCDAQQDQRDGFGLCAVGVA